MTELPVRRLNGKIPKEARGPAFWSHIYHKQVYLETRGHSVDIHVYPILQQLWDAGIQTFFSCQGGPDRYHSYKGKIKNARAMVIILKKDKAKAFKVLANRNPKVSPWPNKMYRDRIAIKFDPLKEAQAVQVRVKAE